MTAPNASIADILEAPFIAKVLDDLHYRANLFNIKGFDADDAVIKAGVELRDFRRNLIGDIDLLIVPKRAPDRSTAIQVKRFPVKAGPRFRWTDQNGRDHDHNWRRSRMQKLFHEGVRQANYALRKVGFSQVYLWLFVLADTRDQNGGRYVYDGPDSRLRSEIEYVISPVTLDSRVGLITFEWTQPMDRPPLALATYRGSLRRLAEPATPPAALTEWLRSLAPSAPKRPSSAKVDGSGNSSAARYGLQPSGVTSNAAMNAPFLSEYE